MPNAKPAVGLAEDLNSGPAAQCGKGWFAEARLRADIEIVGAHQGHTVGYFRRQLGGGQGRQEQKPGQKRHMEAGDYEVKNCFSDR